MPTTGYKVLSKVQALRGRGGDTIYARANPEKVKVTETYEVEQNISVNPGRGPGVTPPAGRIEITVPYDGDQHFTRQAARDVQRAISGSPPSSGLRVVTGHLLLGQHELAGLPDGAQMRGQYGILPVAVPVSAADLSDGGLAADQHACAITYDYQPKYPEIIPAQIDIDMYDPDTLDFMDMADELQADSASENAYYAEVIAGMRDKGGFENMLMMAVTVTLELPFNGHGQPAPRLRRFSIDWPTITSMNTTTLEIEARQEEGNKPGRMNLPVRYNPVEHRLEWESVQMARPLTSKGGGRPRTRDYECMQMLLSIEHPGELYRTPKLKVRAEIEIPGYLMSGLEPRLFNAFGKEQERKPMLTTRVNVNGTLVVDDAFARRSFSPCHRIFFDDIVPDDMRISDIRNVLRGLRFDVFDEWSYKKDKNVPPDTDFPQWFLKARRSQGPDQMDLRISVEGSRHVLNRKQKKGDRHIETTQSKRSGQIRLSVLGRLPRDHQEVTREMNALQKALRDRYRPHQDSRR
jgi:hypothetical protein